MNDKGYSLRQAAKLSGVPTMTFHAWKEKGLVTPDVADNKGNISLFSEMMIGRAKEIDAKRKAKKFADISGNLFADTVESVANTDNFPQNSGEGSIEGTAAENDSGVKEVPRLESLADLQDEIAAPMSDDQNEKINSDAIIIGDDSKGEVNPFVEAQPVVPAPVETSETTITIDIDVAPVSETITLEDRANKIRQLQADVQRGIIAIGFELIAAKKEIEHGGWADWLKENFDWTQQTANRFMRVAERFGKLNNVVQFQPSTLQAMLALPEGDEERFIEAQAEAGKPVESQSARDVQKAVKEWNQQRNSAETKTPPTLWSICQTINAEKTLLRRLSLLSIIQLPHLLNRARILSAHAFSVASFFIITPSQNPCKCGKTFKEVFS